MPRDYAPLYASIWNDQDWRALLPQQQLTYLMLMSNQRTSACGVFDAPLSKLTKLADGLTVAWIEQQVDHLIRTKGRFLLRDDDTGEILVRTYVKYDGLIKMARPAIQIARDWRLIESPTIAEAVLVELRNLHEKEPKLVGWDYLARSDEDFMDMIKPTPNNVTSLTRKG